MKIAKLVKQKFLDLSYQRHRAKLKKRQESFSNFDEEKILKKYISQFGLADYNKTIVDIGAGNGIKSSNTYTLFTNGWNGIGVEFDSYKICQLAKAYKYYPNVSACRCQVTPYNVVSLLQAYEIEKDFSLLSIDIDSYDYWVLDALLSEFRPRIIVTEFNEKIPPPIKFAVKYDPEFQLRHHFFGYSIASLADLQEKYDYALLEIEYNNAFLAPKELPGVKPLEAETAYRKGYLNRADRKDKFRLNFDMEILHSLSPQAGADFLNDFYSQHQGKYELSVDID